MLVTTSEKLMEEVEYEVQRQLALLSRWEIAEKSLANSKLILVKDMDEAIALTNEYAPEHLIIETRDYEEQAERIVNAALYFWFPVAGECRRLRIGNQSYAAHKRLCQSLWRSESG